MSQSPNVTTRTAPRRGFAGTAAAMLLATVAFAGPLNAAVPSPHALLESVKAAMLTELEDPAVRGSARQVNEAVERVLLPHIDIRTASRLVLGPHWKPLDGGQRDAFVAEFERYLVRFYAGALAGYVSTRDIPEDFMVIQAAPAAADDRTVTIASQVRQPDRDAIPVNYRFLLGGDAWRVIDVTVNGISIARLYRGQFASIIEREGVEALIAQLRAHNATFGTP